MTSYKNSKPVIFAQTRTIETGGMRESSLTLNSHVGTHVDAPSHKLPSGAPVDAVPLRKLIGQALVIDCTQASGGIHEEYFIDQEIEKDDIVLLKTKNSLLTNEALFNPEFVYLAAAGAKKLAALGVKAVGIDYLGIERNSPTHETHTTLLQADIPIIEGLRLGHVAPGRYAFYCLPLAVQELEAAPARAILIQ